ncbi:malate synthase-like [Tachysurus fulvidraco]|uniref:malate synthase-like n=1 Tax=Tachysurus fulvidraco TaxID=1234273 RepID=UPI001FF03C3B|nr:malate synthase-like [Tachysurus fulvidraco]XP_027007795.2 malate synthase-like [Tachysurus fulvidraco]
MLVPYNVEVEPPPPGLQMEFETLFSTEALQFLSDLCSRFQPEVDKVLKLRILRKVRLDLSEELPGFTDDTAHIRNDPSWRVSPVPVRLQCRHVDIGDLAPCDTQRLIRALKSTAQGIQVDFDDGNCPTYRNQIKGIYNVYKVVHNQFHDAPPIYQAPVLMLRPRAWNMVEHNMLVNGQEVPGPLFDFGLLMFHNAKLLLENQSGPFFYLSKVESYLEARLWNQIFLWTEDRLGLPVGSIKATVLIECVLATFEMEEILYELKEHSAGLNCGIWDYSASFVNKFGHRAEFLLPDRSKYVNMEKRFLRSYMELLVQTCHRRGALATGGMAALLLPPQRDSALYATVLNTVTRLKLLEIKAGVDGFMVYDMNLIEPMQKLFQLHCTGPNQLQELLNDVRVTPEDLLTVPAGGVTLYGLKHNIAVGVLFIEAWLSGRGHFFFKGQVEDSATAEISRSQVWQWIRHQVKLEDDGKTEVTRGFVRSLTRGMMADLRSAMCCQTQRDEERLIAAMSMFLELVQKNDFPEFLTTYLYLDHTFLSSQHQHEDGEMAGSHRAKL